MASELYYISRPSTRSENAPLLIMCHGYGSDENDLFSFASELPKEVYIVSIRAPYPLQPYGNAWYAINFDAEKGKWSDTVQAVTSRDALAACIDDICQTLPVDSSNITLLGFSQGTILSYALALTYPKKVKNIIALSGYINTDIIPKTLNPDDYTHLDIYCSHGTMDQVLPVDWARTSVALLKELQIQHQYSEFPTGHGVAPQNFYELRDWLSARI